VRQCSAMYSWCAVPPLCLYTFGVVKWSASAAENEACTSLSPSPESGVESDFSGRVGAKIVESTAPNLTRIVFGNWGVARTTTGNMGSCQRVEKGK
jgi:hypothetical protein